MFYNDFIFDYIEKYQQKYQQKNLLPPKKHFLAKNNLLQNSFVMVAVVIASNYWLYFFDCMILLESLARFFPPQ